MNKLRLICFFVFSCSLLTACDTYPYKKDIQEIYDWNNQSGNRAICMMVSDIARSNYPHTTKHMEGEDLPFPRQGPRYAFYNRLENENFHYFSELGFFTEEYVGDELGKPIYRYDLTDLGRQYVDGGFGGTNFCFGRIVVDSIDKIKQNNRNNFGITERYVDITYHVENIPDWMKNSDTYIRYRYPKEFITGEPLEGQHIYRVLSKNKLETAVGISGRYQWATRSDSANK